MKIEGLGLLLFLNTAVPCLLASFCFYKSAAPYYDFKVSTAVEKLKAIDAAESGEADMRASEIESVISLKVFQAKEYAKAGSFQVKRSLANRLAAP